MDVRQVAVVEALHMDRYHALEPPFHPAVNYPELGSGSPLSATANPAFDGLRDLFRLLGLDRERFGSVDWNPLGDLIRPGDRVVIKPNWVVSEHPLGDEGVRHTVTDGPILRAIAEYALLALGGTGTLAIGDSPIKETDFEQVTRIVGAPQIVEELSRRSQTPIILVDYRDFVSERSESAPVGGERRGGDPKGYVHFDLGSRSALEPVSHLASRFRSTAGFYENRMEETHGPGVHRYGVSRTVIDADVLINVPKLKTHSKAGITVGLKNAVGICNEKRWLPHHRFGSPAEGGDFYRDGAALHLRAIEGLKDALMTRPAGRLVYPPLMQLSRAIRSLTGVDPRRVVRDSDPYQNGGWHGNDTVWRMVVDLNRILTYGTHDGTQDGAHDGTEDGTHDGTIEGRLAIEPTARRRLTIVDGIWAGDGNGPLKPKPKNAGVLLAGSCNVLVDYVSATLMGFDADRIALIREAMAATELPLAPHGIDELEVVSDRDDWTSVAGLAANHLGFDPPDGWAGHLRPGPTTEVEEPTRAAS